MTERLFIEQATRFLLAKKPFFFMVNFKKTELHVCSFEEALTKGIRFNLNGISNIAKPNSNNNCEIEPITVVPHSFEKYLNSFEEVVANLQNGNSFLVNLTFPSKINSKIDLETVFQVSKANYKLFYKNRFVCFSPECFIKINKGYIYSYPMKGTIDASLDNAEKTLLNDPKEEHEHNTIVDLIRNDLSMMAREVTVTKFRYIEKIASAHGEILQTSSEIRGTLPHDWKNTFARNLLKMLPAGSISGAPKPKTLEIIEHAENYERGFYTGVFGVFDGENIDSAVAIRFIEQKNNDFWYKSGGGITHQSNVKEEYIELLNKIYIPTF